MADEKEEIDTLLKSVRDEPVDEDIQYRRYVLEKIRRGLESAETQPTFTQEEAKARLRIWRGRDESHPYKGEAAPGP
ncbi:MAG TPA: hypothetical protein VF584_13205 [Longimicrobium sp.]